jgi:hypothetical protein
LIKAGVSKELLPVIESPSLATLAELLAKHRCAYWDPLVMRQILYLDRLRHDPDEWQRLGWEEIWEYDAGFDDHVRCAPREVEDVERWRERLTDAHVQGLLPGRCVAPRLVRELLGRPAKGLRNAHPRHPVHEWVDARTLEQAWKSLHAFFKRHEAKIRPRPGASERIRKLVDEARKTCGRFWWSNLYRLDGEQVINPQAQRKPPAGLSATERMLWSLPLTSVIKRWDPIDIDPAITSIVKRKMGRAGKEGRPAYLAYAVLAAHLGQPAEKVRDAIDNLRYRRRK